MYRDEYCGLFCEEQLGKKVRACGWVSAKRDMGGVLFIDLYDKTGVLQVVFNRQIIGEAGFCVAERLNSQSVVAVEGMLCPREEETRNPRIATGEMELRAEKVKLLSRAIQLPFSLDGQPVREDLRLAYRYLDLRRPEMQRNLRFRHLVQKAAQDYLDAAGFLCVETPMLTKSTPEGARDYLVPSRIHKGKFYALPQSPQIFKQLLMVGGVDRYYQVARCFRDEDLRADRQPEFTQVDMEMSFVEQEDVLRHLESMFKAIFQDVMGRELGYAFPRLSWTEAMDVYGSDKPDLRFGLPIVELTDALRQCGFKVFRQVIEEGGVVRAINIPGGASMTRGDIEGLTEKAQSYGAGGMAWIALRENGEVYSILGKYFSQADLESILRETKAGPGDFVLFCADKLKTVRSVLGRLRLDIADLRGLRGDGMFQFLFVTNFPEFEYSEEEGRYVAAHHPFTMPFPEDIDKLETDPAAVRAQAYDVVLNGVELGSGSIRIHDSAVQERMFRALGFTDAQLEERFGFMIRAFRYGTPPHGGFAFGLDRLVMLLLGAPSLREIIAFPKIKDASCPLTQAPSPVDGAQLGILGISLEESDGKAERTLSVKAAVKIDVDRIAELAQLRLSAQEAAQMETDMMEIVAFADTLSQIDTTGIGTTIHAAPLYNVMREDEVEPPLDRRLLLAGTPEVLDGLILVPQVVE
ncbi:MAG: aspartate--tRNA ligase [Candidatus Pelethousia sp.]|nr:aspartate--tRNA ligase [Candidatus Pelethousia sp.]